MDGTASQRGAFIKLVRKNNEYQAIIKGGWIGCEELYRVRRMVSAEEDNILQDLHNSSESRIQKLFN